MELDLRGHPLHTRALSLTLLARADGALDAAAELLDLRKRGFVPVAGDLQASGVIHQMQIDAVIGADDLRLRRIEVRQPRVAFEPSPVTSGESCRDPAERLAALVGEPLDERFASRIGATIGGPLGCTHVLTLAHFLAAAVPAARERGPGGHAAGERVFRRDLVFDAAALPGRRVQLAGQLSDLWLAPAGEPGPPMRHFEAQDQLRLSCVVDASAMRIETISGAERTRGARDFESAPWRDLTGELSSLAGLSLRPGAAAELLRRYGGDHGRRALLAVLLNLAPAYFQCLACLDEEWTHGGHSPAGVVGMGGVPGSCYMWREGGALDRVRARDSEKEAP